MTHTCLRNTCRSRIRRRLAAHSRVSRHNAVPSLRPGCERSSARTRTDLGQQSGNGDAIKYAKIWMQMCQLCERSVQGHFVEAWPEYQSK